MQNLDVTEQYADYGHYQCEGLLAQLDVQVQREEWLQAAQSHARFQKLTLAHFGAEEENLFPAFERCEMGSLGSTALMREEHQRMAILMECMGGALAVRDLHAYLELSMRLRSLLGQHASKEDFLLEVLLGTRSHVPSPAAHSIALS